MNIINFNNLFPFQLIYNPDMEADFPKKIDISHEDQIQNDLLQKKHISIRNKLMGKVAVTCFTEISVTLLTSRIACCFIATTWIPTTLTISMSFIALTTFFHIVEAFYKYQLSCELIKQVDEKSQKNIQLYQHQTFIIHSIDYFIRPYLFALLNNGLYGIFIHEFGHAIAAWKLFENSNPQIEIYPFMGGKTSYKARFLSSWGERFGQERSLIIVTAAGPVFAIFEATLLLTGAHMIKDSYPQLRLYMLHVSFQRVCNHVAYALSALTRQAKQSKGHDFYQLWERVGIHPVTAATVMIALPLFMQLALWRWDIADVK